MLIRPLDVLSPYRLSQTHERHTSTHRVRPTAKTHQMSSMTMHDDYDSQFTNLLILGQSHDDGGGDEDGGGEFQA